MALDENLLERLSDATKGLRQAFYFSVIFALLAIYLLIDYRNPLPPEVLRIKDEVQLRLAELEPTYAFNDSLRSDGTAIHAYFRFLEPFVAIDTAAEQAVAGASIDDPRWLALDPTDRNLARSTRDMVQWLEHKIEWHMDSDLRELPVFNLPEFYTWYIRPEQEFSNESATRRLQASYRVAKALGQEIEEPAEWPASYYLYDFLVSNDRDALVSAFEAARRTKLSELKRSVAYLEKFCEDNEIQSCTSYQISAELDRGSFKIDTQSQVEKIEISFFPGGLETQVFVLVSPFLLFGSIFVAASQYYRRLALLAEISKDPDWRWERDVPWLMTNIRSFSVLPPVLRLAYSIAGACLFVTGLMLPVIAQSLSLKHSLTRSEAEIISWGWPVGHGLALAMSGFVILLMISHEFSAVSFLKETSKSVIARYKSLRTK